MRLKLLGFLTGVLLAAYGLIAFWAAGRGYNVSSTARVCEAWLCPDEFSVPRVFELGQQTRPGANALLALFIRALEEDNASAYRWADLGEEEEKTTDFDRADYCFEQALKGAPRNPAILFRAANYEFRNGREEPVLRNLRKILINPELTQYYEPVYLTYSRLGLPLEQVLEEGMPPLKAPANGFLAFLVAKNRLNDAKQTWAWMEQRALADDSSTGELLKLVLSNKGEDDQAVEIWEKYAASKEEPDYRRTNWLFNGSFERPFHPSPLDWNLEQTSNVHAERSSDQSENGKWSAKLTFLGKDNAVYRGAYQFAVSYPGKWRLTAQVKTEDVTTDEGAAIHVFDVWKPQQLDLWSSYIIGTQNWMPLELTFEVQPGTKLLRVDLGRKDSLHLDSRISGSAWFDSVVLKPAD